jgi:class 3 adenylate cyclase
MRPAILRIRYAAGLTFAFLLTAAEVIAVVLSLGGRQVITIENLVTTVALVVGGTVLTTAGGAFIVAPSVRLLDSHRRPTEHERRSVLKLTRRQSVLLLAPWAIAGAVLVPLNRNAGVVVVSVVAAAVMFGASASMCTGFLFTQRTLRPLMAAVEPDFDGRESAPGVVARLVLMWAICTALPAVGIALLIVLQSNGWLIPRTTSVQIPVLVLALVAVFLGLRAMILVSRSISDPVREVVDAMAEVEQGRLGKTIDVYEQSEIGRLQKGFNRMVAGLQERDRLRDLFGRHVGEEVVRRAIQENESVADDEREVAILFIDLVGSTQLAATREPHEVAEILNDFFGIVVAAVDARHGLINKFQGDAALAVFGAPLRIEDPATAALATARTLGDELRRLPVDFGIGVSAGPVFAGNIGAKNRYEYTVVGDAVNEAARLADRAKEFDGRVLCSQAALGRANPAERRCWTVCGSEILRGRTETTEMSAPLR